MPRALKVTKYNIPKIITDASALHFNLDYLPDSVAEASEYNQALYLIMDGSWEDSNITYTTFWEADFRRLWQFKDAEMLNQFAEIERV